MVQTTAPKKARKKDRQVVRLEKEKATEISHFLFALGNQFINVKNAGGAFDCFKYSTDLDPTNQPAVFNLGALYNSMSKYDHAYRMFVEASRMNPKDLNAKIARCEVARKIGKIGECYPILDEVLQKDPKNYLAMSSMAVLFYDEGRLAEAMEWNKRALSERPGDIHMMLNQALVGMTYGQWPEYWSQYEFCLSYQKNERMRSMRMSEAWAGQEYEGKTLLVVSDQGSGDAIQFSRYLKDARALGKFGKLIYLVQPDLKALLSRVEGVDLCVGFNESMGVTYDNYSSLLGVMRVLKVSPQNCGRPPHLETDPQLDRVWEHRVNSELGRKTKKVGLVWAGDARHGNDHARSLPLAQYLKFLHGDGAIPPPENVKFYSFQVGPPTNQLTAVPDVADQVVELGSMFRNFDDTASAMRQMDLLISCDTSVAHLAGCLGTKVYLLVANPVEWRHLLVGETSPWYPDTRVYRQKDPKDWSPVVHAALADLTLWSQR